MFTLAIASVMSARHAIADIDSVDSDNTQEGDNGTATDQSGEAASGDAINGQVVGSVGDGDTSIDATNISTGTSAETDYASGANSSASFTGLTAGSDTSVIADILSGGAKNVQQGDNDTEIVQAAVAAGGDAVSGQVIGAVTSAGGSTDIVAANTTEDSSSYGGSADAFNDIASFVGLNASGTVTSVADILSASATNVQEGDNGFSGSQSADSAAGDGVAGQVIGSVTAGDASIDATNLTSGSSADGGSSDTFNFGSAFVGLTAGSDTLVDAADIVSASATNVQSGDNGSILAQAAEASAGDAVAGQVLGAVTSAGGSADLVFANTSDGVSAGVGDASFENIDASFTGLNAEGVITVF